MSSLFQVFQVLVTNAKYRRERWSTPLDYSPTSQPGALEPHYASKFLIWGNVDKLWMLDDRYRTPALIWILWNSSHPVNMTSVLWGTYIPWPRKNHSTTYGSPLSCIWRQSGSCIKFITWLADSAHDTYSMCHYSRAHVIPLNAGNCCTATGTRQQLQNCNRLLRNKDYTPDHIKGLWHLIKLVLG